RFLSEQRLIVAVADDNQAFQALRRMRRDCAVEPRRREAHARAGMFEDEAEFGAVQLGIGWHGGRAGVPDAMEDLQIFDAVLRRDGGAVARREAGALAQGPGEARRACGQITIGCHGAPPAADSDKVAVAQAGAMQPQRDVHVTSMVPTGRPFGRPPSLEGRLAVLMCAGRARSILVLFADGWAPVAKPVLFRCYSALSQPKWTG